MENFSLLQLLKTLSQTSATPNNAPKTEESAWQEREQTAPTENDDQSRFSAAEERPPAPTQKQTVQEHPTTEEEAKALQTFLSRHDEAVRRIKQRGN